MPLPEAEIVALLEQLGVPDVRGVAPALGGLDTEIWRIEHGDRLISALRIFREDQTLNAAFERIAMAAAGAAIPVLELRTSVVWHGRPVSLISWQPGVSLGAALFVSPSRAWELGELLGQTQGRLHQVPAPAGLRPKIEARQIASRRGLPHLGEIVSPRNDCPPERASERAWSNP